MKKIILIPLVISLLSCGIKKELATTKQTNNILKQKVYELEQEVSKERESLKKCSDLNRKIYKENKEFAAKINALKNGESEFEEEVVETVFTKVEIMPEFPGGQSRMFSFIGKTVRYPEIARENNVQGKVYIQFVVNKDGSIDEAKVLRGIGYGCDEEALRAVNKMPNWNPGEQKGKPVKVKFVLPVSFRLN